jgi:hypothetical protein
VRTRDRARAISNPCAGHICIMVLSCPVSTRCCSCCPNTCSYCFSVVGARKGGAPRGIDLRIHSVLRIDACHGSNLCSYFYDGTLFSTNLCRWHCCPPLLPFLYQLQWCRAQIYRLYHCQHEDPSYSLGSAIWARCRGTSTGIFTSVLTIMQAVVSLEVDVRISLINLHRLIVGLGFSVSLVCFLAVASEDAPPAVNSSVFFIGRTEVP